MTPRPLLAFLAMPTLAAFPGCGGDRRAAVPPGGETTPHPASARGAAPADSLVLTTPDGATVWFTAARTGRDGAGRPCLERGLEIRRHGRRIPVPLLYTGRAPVLVDDSTLEAELWLGCRPIDRYSVSLVTGQPTRLRP
ncbi:MAG TPA: hypothetical protein VNK43_03245 [Gemmatimonadales bacterium]|nr:hypothetical protein [Gemmatimonadales bacterium]